MREQVQNGSIDIVTALALRGTKIPASCAILHMHVQVVVDCIYCHDETIEQRLCRKDTIVPQAGQYREEQTGSEESQDGN